MSIKTQCCAGIAVPLIAVSLVASVASVGLAQTAPTPPPPPPHTRATLQLRSGEVSLQPAIELSNPAAGPAVTRHVIQLDGPLTAARRDALTRAGVKLGTYLPQYAYVADLRNVNRGQLAGLGFVRFAGAYRREWKLDPRLSRLTVGRRQRVAPLPRRTGDELEAYTDGLSPQRAEMLGQGKVRTLVTSFAGVAKAEATMQLAAIPGVELRNQSLAGDVTVFDAVIPLDTLSDVADLPFVQFIEDAPRGALRNATTVSVVQSGTSAATPVWDVGLHGEGQIVGLIDGPPRYSHCMFDDVAAIGPTHRKFVAYRVNGGIFFNSHGTHVAGTLAGDSGTWGEYDTYDGVAYAARISFSSFFDVISAPATLYPRLLDAHNDGARIHSNSWGDDTTTAYTTWCNQADAFSYDHEDDLVCFAATNLTTLRSPENAKNILSVGASQQFPSQDFVYAGGRGPTFDNRRKPEIFAPGRSIRSASVSSCSTVLESGTSMACPAIAGSAALVREYFTSGYYPEGYQSPSTTLTPTGALMKAVLLNATVDMAGVTGFPSNREGWGRLVLDQALYFAGEDRRLIVRDVRNASGLQTSESFTFNFTVWQPGSDLRIAMVFTDPPGAVGAANPVVNDLDLIVIAPNPDIIGGSIYRGNYFKSNQSAAGGVADPLNNVEQVYLPAPPVGTYSVQVQATAVNSPAPQGFAIVITGNVLDGAFQLPEGYGDADADGDHDLLDFAAYQRCVTTNGVPITDPACSPFDADADGDVDAADYPPLKALLTGP